VKIMKLSSLCSFLQSYRTFSLFCPNTFLHTLQSKTLNLFYTINRKNQTSALYKARDKIILLLIQLLYFWKANGKTECSAPNNSRHSLSSSNVHCFINTISM
jgi:hypothetical protein